MAGSVEHQVLIRHTGDLTLAVRKNLTSLGGDLLNAEIITTDQCDEIRNDHRPANDRAVDLVRYVEDKVRQNPRHYYAFIGVLKKDETEYRDILTKLEQSFNGDAQSIHTVTRNPPPMRGEGSNRPPARGNFWLVFNSSGALGVDIVVIGSVSTVVSCPDSIEHGKRVW